MRSLEKRERRLAFLTALVIPSAVLYVGILEPVAENWTSVYSDARNAEERLAALRALAGRQREIEVEYSRLVDSEMRGETEEAFLASLLTKIESLGRSSGLQVTAMKPIGKTESEGGSRYGVEMSARGEPQQFIRLLHSFQDTRNLLVVDRITLIVGRSAPRLSLTFVVSKIRMSEDQIES